MYLAASVEHMQNLPCHRTFDFIARWQNSEDSGNPLALADFAAGKAPYLLPMQGIEMWYVERPRREERGRPGHSHLPATLWPLIQRMGTMDNPWMDGWMISFSLFLDQTGKLKIDGSATIQGSLSTTQSGNALCYAVPSFNIFHFFLKGPPL